MSGDVSADALARLFDSIREIEPFADWDTLSIVTTVETESRSAVGGNLKPRETGREILVISIPFKRDEAFVERQRQLALHRKEELTQELAEIDAYLAE